MKTLISGSGAVAHTGTWQSIKPTGGVALQLCWDGLEGTLDGVYTLELSLDRTEITIASTVVVSTATNAGNRLLLELPTRAGYYRVRYTPNGVTAGTIKVLSEEE